MYNSNIAEKVFLASNGIYLSEASTGPRVVDNFINEVTSTGFVYNKAAYSGATVYYFAIG